MCIASYILSRLLLRVCVSFVSGYCLTCSDGNVVLGVVCGVGIE